MGPGPVWSASGGPFDSCTRLVVYHARHIRTMHLAAPALVALVGCVLVSDKSDLGGLVVDSANSMAHSRL